MRVLFDTNVLLDVLLNRDPWVTESSAVWQANDEGQIVGHITGSLWSGKPCAGSPALADWSA